MGKATKENSNTNINAITSMSVTGDGCFRIIVIPVVLIH